MSYNYQNFLRPIFENSRNIQILDSNGVIKYTINPFFVINTLVINNLLKINLKNDKVIILDFMNSTQAKSALFDIQNQIESLISKTPFLIDKNIENYIESKILEIQFPGSVVIDVTYSELRLIIATSSLTTGSYYQITDYKTCYDQPDYNYFKNQIGTGNYKDDSPVEPIVVLATSDSTLAKEAYQPDYPNDQIKYDISFDQTERTGGTAYGRITERIDEYNNRTDYDHRQVKFKRYKYYEIDPSIPIQGTVQITPISATAMTVTGTGSNFDSLSVGTVVGFAKEDYRVYRISDIASDTEMTITGLANVSLGSGTKMYTADWDDYNSYYQSNVDETTDFEEYYTFDGTDNYNNYIGNHVNLYQENENDFILANNVFHISFVNNIFGDGCYNNNFRDNCTNNYVGNDFHNNITDNDFDENVIGNDFRDNRITANFYRNRIGNNFYDNYINIAYGDNDFYRNNIMDDFRQNLIFSEFQNNEIGSQFNNNEIWNQFYKNDIGNGYNYNKTYAEVAGNLIGNGFNSNDIYSDFYDNRIGEYFNQNSIGDLANRNNYNFNDNQIGNNFNDNSINANFYDNQIGNDFDNNIANGAFYKNFIGNDFADNTTGHDFYGNRIGNNFDNNTTGDSFFSNVIGEDFELNSITRGFKDNQIGNQFENNSFGDTQYFTWNDTSYENLTTRVYSTLIDALNQDVDNHILNRELIFRDTVNDEYHKVKFTQWTIGNNGGGFSYERTKLFGASGNAGATGVGQTIYFTKTNYGSEIDVIVPGSLEITRGNNGAIYNSTEEGSWNGNNPLGTEWNSVYTQSNNGQNFEDNSIGNEFKGNYIKNYFQNNTIGNYTGGNEFLGEFYDNKMGNYTHNNDFNGYVSGNYWGNGFYFNTIGTNFEDNSIGSGFSDNDIGEDFQSNHILNDFYDNIIGEGFGYGGSYHQGNRIGNHFYNNTIGEYFYNNTIPDNFENNLVGDYFQMNDIKSVNLTLQNFTQYLGNIVSFTDNTGASPSITGSDGTYNSVGASGGNGLSASFNFEIVGGIFSSVTIANDGFQYLVGDNLTIDGSIFGGSYSLEITVTITSATPSVYEYYNTTIFKNSGGVNRLSYYDGDDVLVIKDIDL